MLVQRERERENGSMKSELGGPIDIFFRNLGPHISLYKKPFGAPFVSLLQGFQVSTHTLSLYTTKCKLLTKKGRSIDSKMSKDSMRGSKKKLLCRRLGGYLKEQKGRLYIIRRCVVMLLCWHD
ncbi:hypothetical protein GLYMA_18G280800v4 [Glycine max]|uniref:Uncharacterized protein n=1 Tax=Glycine max TaxID=3847 RepID=K7MV77_SOYBN|nr:hypothetical protein JHK86_051653 [Glycine max]KAG4937590.1 hypothetical protein JHK85_052509 [Glycine max]KAH1156512.1 hypothetical protein GYH30_051353 [Glycine max]KRH01498.1 hypothetical protein GLYMA_18G280800v4 [Glycine max]